MGAVRCEARVGQGRCYGDATTPFLIKGQPYGLCNVHAKMPAPQLLHLDSPLDFEGVQWLYRQAHPRANDKGK